MTVLSEAVSKPRVMEGQRSLDTRPGIGCRVFAKGRGGELAVDDHSDLPYKVHFDDGVTPVADWFMAHDVELEIEGSSAIVVDTMGQLKSVTVPYGPEVNMQCRNDIDGITWYKVEVKNGNEQRSCWKRYNDFKAFDQSIRARSAVVRHIPTLPTSGVFGIRHRLDIGSFNDRRQEDLQRYLQLLVAKLDHLAEEPVVDAFFQETSRPESS